MTIKLCAVISMTNGLEAENVEYGVVTHVDSTYTGFLKGKNELRKMDFNGPLQLRDHVVQNRHTGEQMTHWDVLNKTTKFEFSLFNMAQCVICSPVWRFCTT